jgi:NAD(P)-dependent dehydrogenase (short-subunit alcohol dehydrogenase family)
MSENQKVVLTTGTAGGLGQALAKAFTLERWRVVAASRSAMEPQPNVHVVQMDVTRGPRNVRVNAIFPGVMPSNMTAHFIPEGRDEFAQANALGRINSIEEVARSIVFLTGTQNISGQIFQLDSRVAPWT